MKLPALWIFAGVCCEHWHREAMAVVTAAVTIAILCAAILAWRDYSFPPHGYLL